MAFGNIGRSLTALEIFDLVRDDLNQVEREIGLESVASVEAVTYIGQYLQSGGGKRLRPVLVLLAGRMFNGSGESNPALIRMAAVVEMIHTATLVHDDVIDMAKTRRGRPSINVVWG
ncbi:MAG: polyprenyl synthetase family protein, partial [Polyangiaceae bacterium]